MSNTWHLNSTGQYPCPNRPPQSGDNVTYYQDTELRLFTNQLNCPSNNTNKSEAIVSQDKKIYVFAETTDRNIIVHGIAGLPYAN